MFSFHFYKDINIIFGVINGIEKKEIHFNPYLIGLDEKAQNFLDFGIPYDVRFLPINKNYCFFSVPVPKEETNKIEITSKIVNARFPIFMEGLNSLIKNIDIVFRPHFSSSKEDEFIICDPIDFVKVAKPFKFDFYSENVKFVFTWLILNFKDSFNNQQFFWMNEEKLLDPQNPILCQEEIMKNFINHARNEIWFREDSLKSCFLYVFNEEYLIKKGE